MSRIFAVIVFTLTLVLASGIVVAKKDKPPKNSIDGNGRIPTQPFRNAFREAYEDDIVAAEYDGFVLLQGRMQKDDVFAFSRVSKSWPDKSYNELAMNLVSQITVRSSSTGSNIRPSAQAFVMIYTSDNPVIEKIGRTTGLAIAFVEARTPTGAATTARGTYSIYIFDLD